MFCSHVGGQFICCAMTMPVNAAEQEVQQKIMEQETEEQTESTQESGGQTGSTQEPDAKTECVQDSEAQTAPAQTSECTEDLATAKVLVEEEDSPIDITSYEASTYKTTKHLLASGANATTASGLAAYSHIKDSKITVASIKAKGGKYAKCTAEEKKKGKTEKEYFYKITFENQVSNFVSNGYYDNKRKHHGAVHLVEKCYKLYQDYSQVYSYTVKNDKAKTIDYYYFIYIWRELTDANYHKASDSDYLTYCLEYGTAISKTDAAYVAEKKNYQALSDAQKYKVACAIYYGPHRDANGSYYASYKTQMSTSKGYDPSTWSKSVWLKYAATQFYIWTVATPDLFSHADAVATAKQFDKDYASDTASCLSFYREVKKYAESATKLPSFLKSDVNAAKKRWMVSGTDGIYRAVLTDQNGLADAGTWSCSQPGVTVTVDSAGQITVSAAQPVDMVTLTYEKHMRVPDGSGLLYYADAKSQNMVNSLVSVMPTYGYVNLQTTNTDDTPIQIIKRGDRTGAKYAGAGYAVFTSDPKACVYDPVTRTTIKQEDGTALSADAYRAGYVYWNAQTGTWEYAAGQTAVDRKNAGYSLIPVYHLAYYVRQQAVSATLPGTYCISSKDDGYAESGPLLRRNVTGNTGVNSDYYVIEYQAPQHCELAYPIQITGGAIESGTCCVQWNDAGATYFSAKEQRDVERPGAVKIFKYETGSRIPLRNVVFHLYEDAECTKLVCEMVTGTDGYAYADQIPIGTYYLQEQQGQAVHIQENRITQMEVFSDQVTTVDRSNTPIVIRFHLQKQADLSALPDTTDKTRYSVEGAEYTLYAAEDLSGANGEKLYGKDEKVYTIVCDANGYGEVPEDFAREKLRKGRYYLKETKAPYGFRLDPKQYDIDATDPAKFMDAVDENGDEFSLDQDIYNFLINIDKEQPVLKPVSIHKTGTGIDTTGKPERKDLALAGFVMYDVAALQRAGVNIDRDHYLDIAYDAYAACRVKINAEQENAYELMTDEQGRAQTIPLAYGSYILVESTIPEGFLAAAPQWIDIDADAKEAYMSIAVEDQMITGAIQVAKTGAVPVDITREETVYGILNHIVYDKKQISKVKFAVYDKQMHKLQEIVTDDKGIAVTSQLPLGTYYVQEVYTRNGLVRDDSCYKVELKAGDTDAQVMAQLAVDNAAMHTRLEIDKSGEMIEASTGQAFTLQEKPLAGAVFGIFTNAAVTGSDGQKLLEVGSLVGVTISDQDGKAVYEGELVPGQYYYQELDAPEGYQLNDTKYPFVLELASQQERECILLNPQEPVINRYYKAEVVLRKIDGDHPGQRLKGVGFDLYDAVNDQIVGHYVTDANGEIHIDRMPYGAWYFVETKPLPGYQVHTKRYAFTVDETEQDVKLLVKNYTDIELGYDFLSGRWTALLFLLGMLFMISGIFGMCVLSGPERNAQKLADQYKKTLQRETVDADQDVTDPRAGLSGSEACVKEEDLLIKKKYRTVNTAGKQENYDGVIDCLLEIPKIDMCRVVITGGDVEQNLDRHYFTAARSHMYYGEGSYVIFGHQSFTKNKGMNRLDEMQKGDVIYVSGKGFRDIYEVTEVLVSDDGERLADFAGDEDQLAIYTCKKQHERPKPYMIVRAKKRA